MRTVAGSSALRLASNPSSRAKSSMSRLSASTMPWMLSKPCGGR